MSPNQASPRRGRWTRQSTEGATGTDLPTEDDEWMHELVDRWTEVYKKSATSVILLQLIDARGPIDAAQLRDAYVERTGWTVTERGLYRTLRRLHEDGLLDVVEVDAKRTGAKRNEFTLAAAGTEFLNRVRGQFVSLDASSSSAVNRDDDSSGSG